MGRGFFKSIEACWEEEMKQRESEKVRKYYYFDMQSKNKLT